MPGFLDLPGELRMQVYKSNLFDPHPISLYDPSRPSLPGIKYIPAVRSRYPLNLPTALLRTNKVIHAEASHLLYNRPLYFDWDSGAAWLAQCGV